MSDKGIETCDSCGASVYPEHLESGKAALIDDKLRCPHCLAEYRKTHHDDQERLLGQTTMRAPGEGETLETLEVVDADESASTGSIRAIAAETLSEGARQVDDAVYKRPLNPEAAAATRCRTFHAKLNDGAIAFLNNQINEWADQHAEVTIKYATSTIGVWEGKKADPHLILTVFY